MRKDSTSYGAERPTWDKSDCSVRAVAVACGITYEQSSVLFAAFGRSLKQGTSIEISRQVHEAKLKMYRIDACEMPLSHFALLYDTGSYVVHKKGHAFAVVEGVVHDWDSTTKPSTQVIRAWRITAETAEQVKKLIDLLT